MGAAGAHFFHKWAPQAPHQNLVGIPFVRASPESDGASASGKKGQRGTARSEKDTATASQESLECPESHWVEIYVRGHFHSNITGWLCGLYLILIKNFNV